MTSRALIIQLARLGDLVQSLPVLAALATRYPSRPLDLLCPVPLAPLAGCFSLVDKVLEWNGAQWHAWADSFTGGFEPSWLHEVEQSLAALITESYGKAYVLNQHPRAILAGALLATEVQGPYLGGPLDETLSPWASYLRDVARARGSNRIHLSDAFCGLCGVLPPTTPPVLTVPSNDLPADLADVGTLTGQWVAVVVGAGDADRAIPIPVWIEWISALLSHNRPSSVVLVGSERDQSTALAIQDGLSPIVAGCLWDATGRTTLPQLAALLKRCHWVVGADTGPLHLAAAVGTPVMGFYFSRARIHETGPYGRGHWVWQADRALPATWPIQASVKLLGEPATAAQQEPGAGWSLWQSHHDEWGAIFRPVGERDSQKDSRAAVWQRLSEQSLSLQGVR
ncbi:MAG TPA: glycosyltransferase family 9 protein [Nitrospiraceae bacterium]|nr:glycosyltransferase family 9 protein [Nitrospiraceae bacterium]